MELARDQGRLLVEVQDGEFGEHGGERLLSFAKDYSELQFIDRDARDTARIFLERLFDPVGGGPLVADIVDDDIGV